MLKIAYNNTDTIYKVLMKNKSESKGSRILTTILIILLLAAACLLLAFIVVFPLYKWASLSPAGYSITFIILLTGFIAWRIAKKIISKRKNPSEKKMKNKKEEV